MKYSNLELFDKVLAQLSGDVASDFEAYVEAYKVKNAKVAEKRAAKRAEADSELISVLKTVLNSTPKTRDAILEEVKAKGVTEVGGKAITAQKITSILSDMDVTKTSIKDGKRKKVAYTA